MSRSGNPRLAAVLSALVVATALAAYRGAARAEAHVPKRDNGSGGLLPLMLLGVYIVSVFIVLHGTPFVPKPHHRKHLRQFGCAGAILTALCMWMLQSDMQPGHWQLVAGAACLLLAAVATVTVFAVAGVPPSRRT